MIYIYTPVQTNRDPENDPLDAGQSFRLIHTGALESLWSRSIGKESPGRSGTSTDDDCIAPATTEQAYG